MVHKETFISHQFKTLTKKSCGRSGSLLILVVLILAVAMVLITSALTITVATRGHYYDNALASQASLTAASVAKTIASAAENGGLTKAELYELVIKTIGGVPIEVTTRTAIDGPTLIFPGLNTVSDTGGKTSNTLLEVAAYSDAQFMVVATTPETAKNFKITVTTSLNAGSLTNKSEQTVVIYLTDNNPVYPKLFRAMLNIYGNGSHIPSVRLGFDPHGEVNSNFVTFTGDNMVSNIGSAEFAGNVIITNKISTKYIISRGIIDTSIEGDLVLLGNDASICGDVLYSLPKMSNNSYFLDLCKSAADPGYTFYNDGNSSYTLNQLPINPLPFLWFPNDFKPLSILLENAVVNVGWISNGIIQPSSNIVYVLGSGSIIPDNPSNYSVLPGDDSIKTIAAQYTGDGVVQDSFAEEARPYADRATYLTKLGLADYIGKTGTGLEDYLVSKGATKIDIQNGSPPNITYPADHPSYYIIPNNGQPLVDPITIDLTKNNVDVFIIGTGTLQFNQNGGIRFSRPNGSTHIGRIIFMEAGASFSLNDNVDYNGFPGITSGTPARYAGTAAPITDGSEPFVYVYGFDNTITASGHTFVEGYYGLFGEQGSFIIGFSGSISPKVYARFNVKKMDNESVLFSIIMTKIVIPYCPAPGEGAIIDGVPPNPFEISGYFTSLSY